jgi:membrane protein
MGFERIWRFLPYLWGEFNDKGCRQQAAALTFMTLFAIVPMLTVVYSMFSVVPSFQGMAEQLQEVMFKHFLPDSSVEIQHYLSDFSSQARSLTLVGVGMLVATAYLMLKNIEKTFNNIWGVKEARKGLSNFLLYWAVLSLGPLLLGIGMGMSTYLISLRLFVDEIDVIGVLPVLLTFVPWVLTAAAFTLLFAAVPNCKVPVRQAFIGGLITAVCFELFKDLFGWIVANSSYQAIYGAFAFFPLFLLWLNILWMIVLAGAVLVRTLSTYGMVSRGQEYPDLIAAMMALWHFNECRKTGVSVNDDQLLEVGIVTEQWQRVRDGLRSQNVIATTQQGDYVLSRDLHTITLRHLADMMGVRSHMPGVSHYLQKFDWFSEMAARLLSIDQHIEVEFDVPIGELFATAEDDDANQNISPEDDGLDMLREELNVETEDELTAIEMSEIDQGSNA